MTAHRLRTMLQASTCGLAWRVFHATPSTPSVVATRTTQPIGV